MVVPTFNCALYIGRALRSVLAQTLQDFEIVVVDDGSTDPTGEVLRDFLRDPRIRSVVQENRGLPGARNTGIRESRAPYVACLDADDELAPDALAALVAALDAHPLADWAITDVLRISEARREVLRSRIPEGDLLHGILRDDFVRRGMFFRRDCLFAVGLYDEAMRNREDWDLNIRMIHAGKRFIYLPETLYWYHWRDESITTGDPSRMLTYTGALLRKHHKTLADAGDRVAGRLYAENMWDLGRRHLHRRGSLTRALGCARESLRYDTNLPRLIHPIGHHLGRILRARRNGRFSA